MEEQRPGFGVMTPTHRDGEFQGGFEDMSSFADRFFWARHRARIGAPTIADKTGCAQALIANIEKSGAQSSKFNDKFAQLFGVDAEWLRSGAEPVPQGFNAVEARRMRKAGPRVGGEVVSLQDMGKPRWAETEGGASIGDEERAGGIQKAMFAMFQDYTAIVGRDRAKALVEILGRLADLSSVEKSKRDNGTKSP